MICKILKIFVGIVFVVFLCSGTVVNAETFYYANGHRIQWEDETWLNGIRYRAIKKLSQFSPVPMEKLDNAKLLHWNLTDEQYAGAYGEALQIAKYAVGLSLKQKLKYITIAVRSYFDKVGTYSTDAPHWLDAYGFYVLHKASCQGAACAVGMCLNILDIPYEHINHNKWEHQWCRVYVEKGKYWICDSFGCYFGEEPGPYRHPFF